MANYDTLKSSIQAVIRQNGNNEITGALLQQSLLTMISSLGAGYQFMGTASPTTNPGIPDQRVFYIVGPGVYTNFNGITVDGNSLSVLYYDTSWHKTDLIPKKSGFHFVGQITESLIKPTDFGLYNPSLYNFWFCDIPGTYDDFGGVVVNPGELAIIYNIDDTFGKLSLAVQSGRMPNYIPAIAPNNNYAGTVELNGNILSRGIYYNDAIQKIITNKPIVGFTASFTKTGKFVVVKNSYNNGVLNFVAPTVIEELTVERIGLQTLYLSTPLILKENEWLGFFSEITVENALFQTGAEETPSMGIYYSYENGTNWLFADINLQVGINFANVRSLYSVAEFQERFSGKRIAILGDSISTYQGWIPTGYQYFYPSNSCPDVNDVNKTYWKIVADKLGLEITNCAYSGSTCAVTGGYGVVGCSDERVAALGADGDPDIVLCFIGINDWGYGGVDLGDWTPKQAIPTDGNTFCNAYALMLSKIQIAYPNAKIFCATLLPDKARDTDHQWPLINSRGEYQCDYNEKVRQIAKGMGCQIIEFAESGICWNTIDDFFGDYSATYGIHPNAAGHQKLAAQLLAALQSKY